MEEYVPKKHPKHVKPIGQTHLVNLAKVIRNVPIPQKHRTELIYAIAKYFERVDYFFNKKKFIDTAFGTLHHDSSKETFSEFAEKKDDTQIV